MVPLGLFLFCILSHLATRYFDKLSKLVLRQFDAREILVAIIYVCLVQRVIGLQYERFPALFDLFDAIQKGQFFHGF